jgi:hypothetical protein
VSFACSARRSGVPSTSAGSRSGAVLRERPGQRVVQRLSSASRRGSRRRHSARHRRARRSGSAHAADSARVPLDRSRVEAGGFALGQVAQHRIVAHPRQRCAPARVRDRGKVGERRAPRHCRLPRLRHPRRDLGDLLAKARAQLALDLVRRRGRADPRDPAAERDVRAASISAEKSRRCSMRRHASCPAAPKRAESRACAYSRLPIAGHPSGR